MSETTGILGGGIHYEVPQCDANIVFRQLRDRWKEIALDGKELLPVQVNLPFVSLSAQREKPLARAGLSTYLHGSFVILRLHRWTGFVVQAITVIRYLMILDKGVERNDILKALGGQGVGIT